ncbi:MAG: HAMP domain-containing histidine kinase [Chloroflexota bacterium]|nr:HAMP domain-containing histidine kinase [Chloroflexota bacterium]
MIARIRRRSFAMRTWLALALGTVFVVPTFAILAFYFHVVGVTPPEFDAAMELAQAGAGQWHDPAWQAAATNALVDTGVAVLLVEDGQEVYRSTTRPLRANNFDGDGPDRSLTIIEGERERSAYLYPDNQPWATVALVPVVALVALLVTITAIAWFLGRTVTNPLAAMSQAARRVAAGDLEITLPASRIREVAEVSTAFEAMSDELRASLQHQSALEQERRLFIGAVVHDLRTPLFSLRGYLEGLSQGLADTPAKQARYISGAQEKAAALERLVSDLFNYARLEYLDQAPNQQPLNLTPLLHRLVDGLQPQAAAKRVSITLLDPSGRCPIEGDSHLLTRAIENLLDNAVRYTPDGGEVRVGCHVNGDRVRFTITDTGPGIAAADLAHLFTPLYRGESSRNRRTGGAGLGLTVARRILRAHGGDLTADNQSPHGAVFTGNLPLPLAVDEMPPAA